LDIHTTTAAKIFKLPLNDIDKTQRMIGKTMNFETLYGQGPHALSRQLKVDYQTARQYILEYFEEFPKVRQWMANILEAGYKNGYVETLWGRRRYIPELQGHNRMFRAAGERAAVNHPVQGTAADMIKKAMVDIGKELEGKESCKMILQVHDELLFECDPKELKETAKMVKEKMENALVLSVPIKVDLKSGPNWGEMEVLAV
jgi:DNA polymerase I